VGDVHDLQRHDGLYGYPMHCAFAGDALSRNCPLVPPMAFQQLGYVEGFENHGHDQSGTCG
jgi:hypothetical protein